MSEGTSSSLELLLGSQAFADGPEALQAGLRTAIIYAATLLLVRLGSIRLLSKATAFDVVVGIMLGSIMSRAINGTAPLLPTITAGAVLIGVHWLFARVAYHTEWMGPAIKGGPVLLIKDGKLQKEEMQHASITINDLSEALRLQTQHADVSRIKRAYLERNGQISVVPYEEDNDQPNSDDQDETR